MSRISTSPQRDIPGLTATGPTAPSPDINGIQKRIEISAEVIKGFTSAHLEDIAALLARDPALGAPFALSYELHAVPGHLITIPDVSIWTSHPSGEDAVPVGSRPELGEHLGLPALRFISHRGLKQAAEQSLKQLNPHGLTRYYTFAITPFGAVIVANHWRTRYSESPSRVAAALIPVGLTSHAKLAAGQGLAQAISHRIRYQNLMAGRTTGLPWVSVRIA